jgi:hypothetical protein
MQSNPAAAQGQYGPPGSGGHLQGQQGDKVPLGLFIQRLQGQGCVDGLQLLQDWALTLNTATVDARGLLIRIIQPSDAYDCVDHPATASAAQKDFCVSNL